MFLFNISCLQLCQMFYRGQLCELDFQILEHKQCRRPPPLNFPSDLRHCLQLVSHLADGLQYKEVSHSEHLT